MGESSFLMKKTVLICDIFLYYRTRSTSAPSSVRSRRSTRSVWNSTPSLSAGKRVFFFVVQHRKGQKRRHNHDPYTKMVMKNREKAGFGIRLCFCCCNGGVGRLGLSHWHYSQATCTDTVQIHLSLFFFSLFDSLGRLGWVSNLSTVTSYISAVLLTLHQQQLPNIDSYNLA